MLLAEAISTYRLVTPLLNAAFKPSVPSHILFSITCGLGRIILNQKCIFSCRVAI